MPAGSSKICFELTIEQADLVYHLVSQAQADLVSQVDFWERIVVDDKIAREIKARVTLLAQASNEMAIKIYEEKYNV